MSVVRLLPAWLHAVADYAVGLSLIVVAMAVGGSGTAVAAGVVVGAVVLAVSLITNYQYSEKREWSPSGAVAA